MKGLTRKGLVLAVSIVIGLLAAETVLRLFVVQERKRLSMYDPDYGWRGQPYGEGVYRIPEENIAATYRYNNYGFRDEDILEAVSEDELRIVLLGDSFLECLELEYADIYHELVESRLQETYGPASQIIILGAQGYSNSQQLLAYRKHAEVLQADVVLTVLYTGNDFEDNQRKHYAYLDAAGELQIPEHSPPWHHTLYRQARRWLYENSHLVFLAKNVLEQQSRWKFRPATKSTASEGEQYKQDITRELLLRTQKDVERRGARFGVIVIPSRKEIQKGDLSRSRLVVQWCHQQQVPVLNLSRVLEPQHYFQKDPHFNQQGHLLATDHIFQYLVDHFGLNEPGEQVAWTK